MTVRFSSNRSLHLALVSRVVSSLSFGVLAVACGGAPSPEASPLDGAEGTESPGPIGSGGTSAGPTPDDDAEEDMTINELVLTSGKIDTDLEPDLEPQRLSEPAEERVGEEGAEFSCTTTDYSLTKVPEKFVALNPNADVLYAGSLVQGASMAGGILDPIPVKRAPGSVTLTISSGTGSKFFRDVEEPSLARTTQAQNDILSEYAGATPAKFSYSYESIHSTEQLAVAVSANVKGTSWAGSASFNFDSSDTKSRVLVQFTQEYYTMAFGAPQGAQGTIAPSVTAEDLAPYVGPGNPPVYVASATYGRIFYLLFESSTSRDELSAAIAGSFSALGTSGSAEASAEHKTLINEANIRAYGLGGNAQDAIAAATGYSLDDEAAPDQHTLVQEFLTKGANFDKDNPGVPISYTIRYLHDSTQVRLALTTEYTAKNCVPVLYGCDGVEGSTLVTDECGVCGGDGTSCKPRCGSRWWEHREGNGAFVSFLLPDRPEGSTASWRDGYHTQYKPPTCRGIGWEDIEFTCSGGAWRLSNGADFYNDAWCHGSTNDAQQGLSVGVK